MDDFIIDFNANNEISGLELLNAIAFFKNLSPHVSITKSLLTTITECKVEMAQRNNFFVIKFFITFKMGEQVVTPLLIPRINASSPALATA